MTRPIIKLWHKAFGCGRHRETGVFYARCKRCCRAWSVSVWDAPVRELDSYRAAVILDREHLS